jgi:dienelactone hydrolase
MASTTAQPRRPRRSLRSSLVAVCLVTAAVGMACSESSDKTSSGTTTGPATSTSAPRPVGAYAGDGPYQAGVLDLALGDGRRVVAWYPAAKAAARDPKETFDIASLVTPQLQAKVPAATRRKIQYEMDAHQGAAPAAGGPFPLVLFSHGYGGFPEQSANLTTHLARWGFVVVAPDHVERSLDGLLGTALRSIKKPLTDPQVLSQSLDLALAENGRSGSPLKGLVDGSEVAVIGHSAGAEAAYDTASIDRRIKSFISYSVSLGGPDGQTVRPPPRVPGMVMVGTTDGVIPIAANRNVYRAMRPPKYLVTIRNAGHLVFSDVCVIGRSEGGLVSLVKQVGLDIPKDLLKLGDDGCKKGDLDPVKAFPAINHLSVAFLRSTLGVDPKPVGLGPSIVKAFPAAGLSLSHEG